MKIAVLSRQPSVHANRRFMEAGAQRGCSVSVLDPLSLPLVFSDGSAGGMPEPSIGFDAVIPRFSPVWQRQGRAVLMHWESRGITPLNGADAMSAARDKP
ncbi:MAG TPA: 30S ribosomal protein S6--L-glutamate ligase, partial [Arenimonas sp.]|nr:30S ribosomal protein S6--L-glutamate ligase [Arenimonas sp.]